MPDSKYGVIKQVIPPIKELLVVPHDEGDLTVSYPAFGPAEYYVDNLKSISKLYSHPVTEEQMRFRPAKTYESISALAYGFGSDEVVDAHRDSFHTGWIQAGYIVKTKDGVFTNTQKTDENVLKQLLNNSEKINGIYLLNNGIGFAPYDSFKIGEQDCDTFAHGGLARILEYTPNKVAEKLLEISSNNLYNGTVQVWDPRNNLEFEEVKIIGLFTDDHGDGEFLRLENYPLIEYPEHESYEGYAYDFGVLK